MANLVAESLIQPWKRTSQFFPQDVRIIENKNFIAFKSPVEDTYLNWVWAEDLNENIVNTINDFYDYTPHCYYIDENNKSLVQKAYNSGLIMAGKYRQFAKDLSKHTLPTTFNDNNKEIKICSKKQDFRIWCDLFCKGYGAYAPEYIYKFITPFIEQNLITLTLTYYKNLPVTTGMMYISKSYSGIFAISTLPNFRRKGLAKFTSNFLTSYARDKGCSWVALNSTTEGNPLYINLGFQPIVEEVIFTSEKHL